MKFLVDRCAGRGLSQWLVARGHDSVYLESVEDPGDAALLTMAVEQGRILVTLDNDFGELIFHQKMAHHGLIRLPDVPVSRRIELMGVVLERFGEPLRQRAVVSVRGNRIRVTLPDITTGIDE